ncbi:kinase-like domain-containing protein [Gigaspora rosea]|uniref:Kinase-like domain-containing protein n=1 Tax=Gigaspora rosea TaxID=44941 RepID=A0A397VZU6_9GLOM|nr:kinase-like domain-containing protein [Gigaspora rosea]
MSEEESQEIICSDNIKWIKKLMNSRLINFIDYKEFVNYDFCKSGGSGIVSKAQWKMNNNKTIALKQIASNEVLDQSKYEELTKEVKALRRIDLSTIKIGSENVIEFFGISMNSENGHYFLVLEYAELGNLREYLRANASSWEKKVNITRQVISGLYYLHKNEILHRDLHSENIVVKGDNNKKDGIRVLITDFGASEIISHLSLSRWGIKNECIRYMDPVILTNIDKTHEEKKYDYSSDIYSLGIIMWDISNNGKKIFENANDNEAVHKITIKQEREKPVYGSTHSYVELYKQCWDNNPKCRPDIESVYKLIHEDDIVSGKLWEENTSKIEHNQFLGNRIVHPIENEENLENLILIEIQLRKEVEDIEEVSNVGFGLVDKQEVFIITLLPGTKTVPAKIPSAFHKYPILIHYGIVKAFCVPIDFHDLLELGISIGNDKGYNACTLGLITQFKTNSEKNIFLRQSMNTYPGCAKVTKYHHLDIDQDNHIIDYAFCEIIDDSRIKSTPNELCILSTTIGSFNLSVNGKRQGTFLKVHKVGRTTSHTTAKLHDYWVECKFNWFDTPRKIQALKVYSTHISFGTYGDSGSPIFDEDNKLVGILHSGIEYQENYSEVYIIPIKLIIEHMKNTFGIEFDLI